MKQDLKGLAKSIFRQLGLKVALVQRLPVGADLIHDLKRAGFVEQPLTLFDVGANVGQTALSYHRGFPGSTIYSFEPVRQTFEHLLESTKHLINVHCFQLALGSEVGRQRIFLQSNSQWNSLTPEANQPVRADQCDNVEVMTLDRFCIERGISSIDLLKIDTEGFELEVLRGAKTLLAHARVRHVICEATFDDDDRLHGNFFSIHDFLREHGFRFICVYDQVVPRDLSRAGYCNALFGATKKAVLS